MLKKILKAIGGKKTYVAAAGAVATAVVGYANGEIPGDAAIQLAVTGVIAATLRNAIGKLLPA